MMFIKIFLKQLRMLVVVLYCLGVDLSGKTNFLLFLIAILK